MRALFSGKIVGYLRRITSSLELGFTKNLSCVILLTLLPIILQTQDATPHDGLSFLQGDIRGFMFPRQCPRFFFLIYLSILCYQRLWQPLDIHDLNLSIIPQRSTTSRVNKRWHCMSAVEWGNQVFINFQKQIAWPRKRSQKHNLIHWNLFIFSHIYSDYTIEVVILKESICVKM